MNFNFEKGEIILIDKEPSWTSFDVIKKIKSLIYHQNNNLKKLKIGHCGTLDPFATGLLIVLTGKLTKEISKFQDFSKTYEGLIEFGRTTKSLDPETDFEEKIYKFDHINEALLKEQAKKFIGKIEQIPPIFSALKLNGKRMCDRARNQDSETIELLEQEALKKKRIIEIFNFQILKVEMPFVHFSVDCSKGTYIRTLAFDFAKSLESSSYLKELRRTRIGDFFAKEAISIVDFSKKFDK